MRVRKLAFASTAALLALCAAIPAPAQPDFRDLNHDGQLNPYEDKRLPVTRRVEDLLGRMTPEEKAGLLVARGLPRKPDYSLDTEALRTLVEEKHISAFGALSAMEPRALAEAHNMVQRIAAESRLGIPVTLWTDPRNHFAFLPGASVETFGFSQWPETLGLAALRDPDLVRRFGRIAAREYRAVGINIALSPQADLATEPRWVRSIGTFGSNPALVSRLAGAYVEGFQGSAAGLQPWGVATIVKHWVGYGALPNGFDSHNYYGRIARLSDKSFALHVSAFDGALKAHAAGVMPAYPIIEGPKLSGKPLEAVGAGFNRQLVSDLLREDKGFKGLVLSDSGITRDCMGACIEPSAASPQKLEDIGIPWGVENLSVEQRFEKGLDAGIDQFLGADNPAPLVSLMRQGKVSQARIDQSVRQVLTLKFELGLFDDPYVDADAADRIVRDPAAHALGEQVQRAAQVLLQNKGDVLPIRAGAKVWLSGVNADAARRAGLVVVATPEQADVAIIRTSTPSEMLHPYYFFGSRFQEGRIDFRDGDAGYEALKLASAKVPTIMAVDMGRPAILTNVAEKAKGVLAFFGASDDALLDVMTGKAAARGKLPFELPSSMAAVERQDPGMPDDSVRPLFAYGAGLTLPQSRKEAVH